MTWTSPISVTMETAASRSDGSDGWAVSTSYGDVGAEAEATRTGAGVADVSHWGAFRLSGANAVKYLQGLVTNDVAALETGKGCYAAFLNVHGRIEADVHIFRVDDGLILHTLPEAAGWVEKNLGRFRLAGGFDLTRLSEGFGMLAIAGPDAPRLVESVLGAEPPASLHASRIRTGGESVSILAVPRCQAPSFDIHGRAEQVSRLWTSLVDAGARPLGTDALEIARLEAGIARFSRDFDNDTVLQEMDSPEIVSFHKGCYLGQEIVARLHFQGQPSKLLRRLVLDGDRLPEVGDEIVAASDPEKSAGRVTSVSGATKGGPTVFAIVKRRYYTPGTAVLIPCDGETIAATVAERRPGTCNGQSA